MLTGILAGGLLRLAPEVIKFFDRRSERKQELELARLSIEADKARAEVQIKIQESEAESAYNVGALQALTEAIKSQGQPTGNALIDGLSAAVRPSITFAYFGMYVVCRFASMWIMTQGGSTASEVVNAAWNASDMEMLGGIMNFWFLDRILKRERR